MTVAQLKNQLHSWIDKMDDVEFLKRLLSFSEKDVENKYKEFVDQGEKDILKGNTHTQQQVEDYFKRKFESRNV